MFASVLSRVDWVDMLSVRLMGVLEFRIDDLVVVPSAEFLPWLVRLAASDVPLSLVLLEPKIGVFPTDFLEFQPFIELLPNGFVRLECASDVLVYRASEDNLRELHQRKAEFAPNLEVAATGFMDWLVCERFDLRLVFLRALLNNAVGLEETNKLEEAQKNLHYVEREAQSLEPRFAGLLYLEMAKFYWRRNRVGETVQTIELALPLLEPYKRLEASVNYAAALVRFGCLQAALRALETLPTGEARGWALLHRANALRFLGQHAESLEYADAAFAFSKDDEDGFLAMSALTITGEVLLEQAITNNTEPKDAAIALGKAIGIAEVLSEEASALTLAVLAHTHAIWGAKQKALEMGERAFKRARAAKDGTATVRALLALFAITKIGSFARNALAEAKAITHKPLEKLALEAVLTKENTPELRTDLEAVEQLLQSSN